MFITNCKLTGYFMNSFPLGLDDNLQHHRILWFRDNAGSFRLFILKTTHFLEILGSDYWAMKRRILKEFHRFKNFKICVLGAFTLYAVGIWDTLSKLSIKRFISETHLHKRGSNNDTWIGLLPSCCVHFFNIIVY
jgi:hypothetical protein